MSGPLTPDENKTYQDTLRTAFRIADPIVREECPQGTIEEFAVVVAAVFEKIASPLHFLRQESTGPVIPVEDVTPVHPQLARMSNTGPPQRTLWTPYTHESGEERFRAPRSLVGTDYLPVMDDLLAGKDRYRMAELDGQKWVLSASHAKGRYEATLWRKPA